MKWFATPLAVGFAAAMLVTSASAQDGRSQDNFGDTPVLVRAGEVNAGEGRLFPSPVMQDIDGDGLADIVIGDLPGFLTVAKRLPGKGLPRFGPEERLKNAEGNDLKFHNW